jgi:DNA-binding beta-propeller fold protein YncE
MESIHHNNPETRPSNDIESQLGRLASIRPVQSSSILPGLCCAFLLATLCHWRLSLCRAAESYHMLKEVPVTGNGAAHLALDRSAHRLFVAREDKIVIVDTEKETVAGEITGNKGICGFVVPPKFGFGYSINSGENKLNMINLSTLETLTRVDTGKTPGWILYAPHKEELYVLNRTGRSASFYEADDGDPMGAIDLSGTPVSGVADPNAPRVYCTMEDKGEIVVIDTDKHRVLNRWPVAPAKGPAATAIDAANHRLFVGCSANNLLIVDATTGKVTAAVTVEGGLNALAFDTESKTLICAGENATTLLHCESPDKLSPQQILKADNGKQNDVAVDSTTHKIYTSKATSAGLRIVVNGF